MKRYYPLVFSLLVLLTPVVTHASELSSWNITPSGVITSITDPRTFLDGNDPYYAILATGITGSFSGSGASYTERCSNGAAGGPLPHSVSMTQEFGGISLFVTYGLGTGTCASAGDYYLVLSHDNSGGSQPVETYYKLHYNGTTVTPVNPDGATVITTVLPSNGSTLSTSTPFDVEALGLINTTDVIVANSVHTGLSVNWSAIPLSSICTDVICAFSAARAPNFNYRTALNIFASTTQSFDVSSSTPGLSQIGTYVMTTSLQKPSSILGFTNFFGLFNFGYTTIVSTTTRFTIGTSTITDNVLSGIQQQGLTSTTTQAALDSCNPLGGSFSISDCVVVLFVPTTQPDYGSNFSAIANKPPFGYFSQVSEILQGATTTATTTIFWIGASSVGVWFATLIAGVATILWLVVCVWLFRRIAQLDF